MKKYTKLIVTVAVIVVLFAAAFAGYRYLTGKYTANQAKQTLAGKLSEESEQTDAEILKEKAAENTADRPEASEKITEEETETEKGQTTADGAQAAEKVQASEKEQTTQTPDFQVLDMDGKTVSLSSKSGKPVIINFWATWCGPCRSELASFDELYQKYGDTVEFMMVNLTDGARDTEEGVKSFIEENGYTFPVYLDTSFEAANGYGIYSIPMTVLVRSDGTISDTHIGAMDKETIEGYIKNLTVSA